MISTSSSSSSLSLSLLSRKQQQQQQQKEEQEQERKKIWKHHKHEHHHQQQHQKEQEKQYIVHQEEEPPHQEQEQEQETRIIVLEQQERELYNILHDNDHKIEQEDSSSICSCSSKRRRPPPRQEQEQPKQKRQQSQEASTPIVVVKKQQQQQEVQNRNQVLIEEYKEEQEEEDQQGEEEDKEEQQEELLLDDDEEEEEEEDSLLTRNLIINNNNHRKSIIAPTTTRSKRTTNKNNNINIPSPSLALNSSSNSNHFEVAEQQDTSMSSSSSGGVGTSTTTTSIGAGQHDRRGFTYLLNSLMGLIVIGICIMVLYDWKWGLFICMISCMNLITLEQISSYPPTRPECFTKWKYRQNKRRPVLVCLGDSLIHGTMSASIPLEIPYKLCPTLGMSIPNSASSSAAGSGTGTSTSSNSSSGGSLFPDPLWVVNAGQNYMTTTTILNEQRIHRSLSCYPDYILLLIGTNDIRGICNPKLWGTLSSYINNISIHDAVPTIHKFEDNIRSILDYITQASPMTHIAICTLPPLTEDIHAQSNHYIREANAAIERAVKIINASADNDIGAGSSGNGERITILPVHERLVSLIMKNKKMPTDNGTTTGSSSTTTHKRSFMNLDLSTIFYVYPMSFLYTWLSNSPLGGTITWNNIGWYMANNYVMTDGIHLNERGRNVIVDLIVEWLLKKNIAKAIAVKSL